MKAEIKPYMEQILGSTSPKCYYTKKALIFDIMPQITIIRDNVRGLCRRKKLIFQDLISFLFLRKDKRKRR